jgi:hypothetical protein
MKLHKFLRIKMQVNPLIEVLIIHLYHEKMNYLNLLVKLKEISYLLE